VRPRTPSVRSEGACCTYMGWCET